MTLLIWSIGALFTGGLVEPKVDTLSGKLLFALLVTTLWPWVLGRQLRHILIGQGYT